MSVSTYLEALLEDWKKLLAGWASSGALAGAVQQALVLENEPEELKRLVGLWSKGDFGLYQELLHKNHASLQEIGDAPPFRVAWLISTIINQSQNKHGHRTAF